MTKWQRWARLIIAVSAVAFAIVVAFALKRRAPAPIASLVVRTDPGAVIESTGGRVERFKLAREDVRVEYEKQLTYADGSTKMMGVRIVTGNRGGRTFTVMSKEGRVANGESTIQLDGDVRLAGSDGMTARTEHATYSDSDRIVRAPGPVEFIRTRTRATGVGMTYDQDRDVLWILDQAVVQIAKDVRGRGAAEITAGAAGFARRDKYVRFERGMKMLREGQIVGAATATAYLTPDEQQIDTVELREGSRITSSTAGVGGLQSLAGRDMNLKYRLDGETLEHAVIIGDAVIQMAGAGRGPGRRITADTIDIALAPDGSTPTALVGREAVQLALPAETGTPARTIRAANIEAKGESGRGLTRAQFNGNVQYRERGPAVDRGANSAVLDVVLKPGMSALEEARFSRGVRFVDGRLSALAAAARYDLDKGILELTGSEPGSLVPRVVNDQIAVDATRIDVTLAGPKLKATGNVKSVLQPAKGEAAAKVDMRLPAMLKQDEPVNVVGGALDYGGVASRAVYTSGAQLWQGDTSVKADTIVLDDRTADLSASGSVTTTTMLDETGKDGTKQRVRSIGTAKAFKYEDAIRRSTYTDSAHLSGSQGDMTASKIELYLKPSGNEIDRVEAYESVALREQSRRINGLRLTYTNADQRYVVTGAPMTVNDECDREASGRTLTYDKSADTIVIDGNEQTRTQVKGGGRCQ